MDMYAVAARLRRSKWGLWIGGRLLALDALILLFWVAWLVAWLRDGSEAVVVLGLVLPPWTWVALGPLAVLSVIGVVALATAPAERGFRVASSVAIAWIAFTGLAALTGTLPFLAFLGRVLVLALLVQGRTVSPKHIRAL